MQDEQPRLPGDFVDLHQAAPEIHCDLRYFSADNFMGRPLDGYHANRMLMTQTTARALQDVQRRLKSRGLALKLFDAYRPRRAVADILRWARDGNDDPRLKALYYPQLDKGSLLDEGYLVQDSAHSRGSTVDLTLIEIDSGNELDMGTPFDFFDPRSWPGSDAITQQQFDNRMLLRHLMIMHGFDPLETEWWHFTLRGEPYPETWFDVPITEAF